MALPSWQRHYLDALLRSRPERTAQYENVSFLTTALVEPADGIQELLLHRTIAQLDSIPDALQLMTTLRNSTWTRYEPRILARIGDTEAVLRDYPHLADHFRNLRARTGYTTCSIKDWHLIGDSYTYRQPDAPVWASRIVPLDEIIETPEIPRLGVNEVAAILQHFHRADVPIFQLAIITTDTPQHDWAGDLHKVLAAPRIEVGGKPHVTNTLANNSPSNRWAPHWQIIADPRRTPPWHIVECHTEHELTGLGTTGIYDQISVLLAVSGLLREGLHLTPIDDELVQALIPSQPIWGLRRKEFSAARTTYHTEDVRALVIAFLEKLPPTTRVSMFRSRIALRLLGESWRHRNSASILTTTNGFYQQLLQIARLFGENRFEELLVHLDRSPYRYEPAFRYFKAEADAALLLFKRFDAMPAPKQTPNGTLHDDILCVTHASVPDQTGGYAIRAHGILAALRAAGIDIRAATRPGFPAGVLTQNTTVVVDDVEYRRLAATKVTRHHGEIQYMMSFIEPFKELFREQNAGLIHVRSTFLIALPALIAARELGLRVLYEVSGLWELVYEDREQASHLLKRSTFAERAETMTMTHVDQLVVMNESVRQIALDRGVAEENIHVAPNAVDVDSFTPLAPPKNEIFTIGYLGSFQDYEGLDDLIDAVGLLLARDQQVKVIMVGDGLQYNPVRSKIHAAGLEDVFELTGRVPHEAVISHYARMDVLVYPRRSTGATETITPLKPFEALALAKPIIVSDVRPLAEIVGANERGLVFENGNSVAFADAIMTLRDSPQRSASLGAAGRQWVVEHRNWGNVVDTFIDAYRAVQ